MKTHFAPMRVEYGFCTRAGRKRIFTPLAYIKLNSTRGKIFLELHLSFAIVKKISSRCVESKYLWRLCIVLFSIICYILHENVCFIRSTIFCSAELHTKLISLHLLAETIFEKIYR